MLDPHVAQTTPAPQEVDWLYCSVMGLVEGLTEFLPISSTGHLILVGQGIFDRSNPSFDIGIQLGAITAILFLYRQRLWAAAQEMFARPDPQGAGSGQTNLLWLILVAALPASVLGLIYRGTILDLLYNPKTVAISLIVGGVLLWLLEIWLQRRGHDDSAVGMSELTLKKACWIGVFQSLALIPGTSRSAAMIAGALLVGCRRTAAAEFSFLVGLPVLYGAACIKLFEDFESYGDPVRMAELLIAGLTSFLSALLVVTPFVRFLQHHTFRPFAWYRIAVGSVLLALVLNGAL
ncbi:MAG: undecaprenyl-diphosphatase UppP [Planctomycetota bacterium]|nr:undecaprenyl-diphosphatase UppP [Planctomycetota bacterium]